ncbi:MAG TPA: hypothetical protein VF665_06265 [Longimicrobium sp.]|jgi:hypothetical protein|uniref:hypothetical protein n=1 Tax=Longimicrobium sp. TaxID=2029185 RepID=UPI002ED9BFDA
MPAAEPTSATRVRFIEHAGARILLIDLSNLQAEAEILDQIERVRDLVARQPPASVRTITNVTGARYTPPVMDALKKLTAHNKPYVTAAAVVGMQGVHKVLFRAVLLFSRRVIEAFDDMDRARDWVARQP